MQKVRISRIQKQRKAYASNQAFILRKGSIESQIYNEILFETGCKFLEEIYPLNTVFEEHYKKVSRSKNFWLWWRSEWKLWEVGLIEFIKETKLKQISLSFWKQEVQQMALDRNIETSYQNNFIKQHTHGRTA